MRHGDGESYRGRPAGARIWGRAYQGKRILSVPGEPHGVDR